MASPQPEVMRSVHDYDLPREREILMSALPWAVSLALVLPLLIVGEALAQSQADAPHATNLYPGRYVAVCKPAPIIGCLCSSDSQGEISVFPELTGAADHRPEDVKDTGNLEQYSLSAISALAERAVAALVPR
jgi:hypothetical protein